MPQTSSWGSTLATPDVLTTVRRSATKNPLLQAYGSWPAAYESKCDEACAERCERRKWAERERKAYMPTTTDFSVEYERIIVESATDPQRWREAWGRNLRCERCSGMTPPGFGRIECYLCPVVQHVRGCTVPFFRAAKTPKPDIWLCDGCIESLEDSVARRNASLAARDFAMRINKASLMLQRTVRMRTEMQRLRCVRLGLTLLQARVRGIFARRAFRLRFSWSYRPLRIRVNHASMGSCPSGDVGVIVTLTRSSTDGTHEQLFRQDTEYVRAEAVSTSSPQGDGSCYGSSSADSAGYIVAWPNGGAIVKVPCTNAQINAVFTVVSLSPKPPGLKSGCRKPIAGAQQNASPVEFIGQATVNLYNCVLHSRPQRSTELSLGSMTSELLCEGGFGGWKATKILNMGRSCVPSGSIVVDIVPGSYLTSHCGYVGEVSSFAEKASLTKKWFLVLDGSMLRFFVHPSDLKPRHTRTLTFATARIHKLRVIELRAGGEWSHFFTFTSQHDLRKWHARLRHAIRNAAQRRASQFIFS